MKIKLICPNCGEIIEVEKPEKEEPIFCNKCQNKYLYSDIKKFTNQKLTNHLQKGQVALMQTGNYDEAAEEFYECLKVKDSDMAALTGYVTSKIYGMKINEPNFLFIKEEIDSRDIVLNCENSFMLLSLIKDLLIAFKQFIKISCDYIIIDNVFMSKVSFEAFIKGVNEGYQVLKYFNDSLPIMEEEELRDFKENNENFVDNLEKLLEDYKSLINKNYNVSRIGDVEVKNGKIKILGTNIKNVEVKEIDNWDLFPEDEEYFKKKKLITYSFIGVCALALIFVILFFITKIKIFIYLEFLLALVFIIYMVVTKSKNKKS